MEKNRCWQRHTHSKGLVLEFSDGRRFDGYTTNVSLSGLFFSTHEVVSNVNVQEEGVLRMSVGNETFHFPCRVIRVSSEGIALAVTERQAEFGFAISQDVYHELLKKHHKKRS